jgi:hypothetical protein
MTPHSSRTHEHLPSHGGAFPTTTLHAHTAAPPCAAMHATRSHDAAPPF